MAARSVISRQRRGRAIGRRRFTRLQAPVFAGLRMLVLHRNQLGEERRLAERLRRIMGGNHRRQRDQSAVGFSLLCRRGFGPMSRSPRAPSIHTTDEPKSHRTVSLWDKSALSTLVLASAVPQANPGLKPVNPGTSRFI